MQTAKTIVSTADSILDVLRGDLDDQFRNAVLKDSAQLLKSTSYKQTNTLLSEAIQVNLEDLILGFSCILMPRENGLLTTKR